MFVPDTMTNHPSVRFDSQALAKRITQINGGKSKTVKVTMIGRDDVKKLIDKMEVARNAPSSSRLRAR